MVPTVLHAQIAVITGKHLEQQDFACLQTQGCLTEKLFCDDKVKRTYFLLHLQAHSKHPPTHKKAVGVFKCLSRPKYNYF